MATKISVEVVGMSNPVPYGCDGVTVVGRLPDCDLQFGSEIVYLDKRVAVDLSYLPPHVDWEEEVLPWLSSSLLPAVEDDGFLTFYVNEHLASELTSVIKGDMG